MTSLRIGGRVRRQRPSAGRRSKHDGQSGNDVIQQRLLTAMRLLVERDMTDALKPSQVEIIRELQGDLNERYVQAMRRSGA